MGLVVGGAGGCDLGEVLIDQWELATVGILFCSEVNGKGRQVDGLKVGAVANWGLLICSPRTSLAGDVAMFR
ncbi:MAG: hypothetical protein R3C01_15245, partial [Planctomycetaceae bacterium]